jgi:predicted acyl esterase
MRRLQVFTIKWKPVHVAVESVFTIPWKHCSPSRGIRTMANGPKPDFLRKPVAYYVMGEETWRYSDSLEAVTAQTVPYFLGSATNATHVLASGVLDPAGHGGGAADHYIYDPRDVSLADLQAKSVPNYLTDQRLILAMEDKRLV